MDAGWTIVFVRVKIIPADSGDPQMGMMLLEKTYRDELNGTGKGRLLTGMTSIKDSAGYFAIERIEGELNGKAIAYDRCDS